MEVKLRAEVQNKLVRLAAAQGREVELLAQEAIERYLDHDEWFIREVEKGWASADKGPLLTHEEVGERLERLIAEKRSP
jgi:predicted transcriptional regulator